MKITAVKFRFIDKIIIVVLIPFFIWNFYLTGLDLRDWIPDILQGLFFVYVFLFFAPLLLLIAMLKLVSHYKCVINIISSLTLMAIGIYWLYRLNELNGDL